MGKTNLKYFHSCATKRYRKNLIEGVRDGDGNWNVHPEDIAQVFVSYFNTLCSHRETMVLRGCWSWYQMLLLKR